MDDLLVSAGAAIAGLYLVLLIAGAGVLYWMIWMAGALLASRFDLVAAPVAAMAALLALYCITGFILACLEII